ncbi:MAG TPA: SHOCT domain-containing protein [Actinomycetota bacterium]|jgi:putative membrane protein|nr:SHOCT domain-containing protein [Actinomycetota bacterium]
MLMTWGNGAGGPWFLVFPLLWIALVVFAIVAFRGGWRRQHDHSHGPPSPEAILGERFARGEISADEYRERLGVLQQGG